MYKPITSIGPHTISVETAILTSALAKYAPAVIAGSGTEITLGFPIENYGIGERALVIVFHHEVEVDAIAGTYLPGDAVYDSKTAPTGVVDKNSTDRKFVGRVLREADLSLGAGKIWIAFNGQEGAT